MSTDTSFSRARRLFRFTRRDIEADVQDEVQFHLDACVAEGIAGGLAAEVAQAAAAQRFGDVAQITRTLRDLSGQGDRIMHRKEWFGAITQDVRFGLRQLRKSPGFTIVAVLTLALGIGANTAIFSVVYSVLLRPLPYPEPERLVGLAQSVAGSRDGMDVTYHEFEFLAEHGSVFASFAASTSVSMNLGVANAADHLRGQRVSRDYFRVLGVSPLLGREFAADEDQVAGPTVLLLSNALWQRRFGGDSAVIGRSVLLDGKPAVVIGIMPATFVPPSPTDAWSTLAQVGSTVGTGENLEVIGRLAGDITPVLATQRMQVAFADFQVRFKDMGLPKGLTMQLAPYKELTAGDARTPVKILFGAIGFVLLIACANVASLILGRAAARQRELSVRVALGATRGRIVRQILTESLLLSLLGGAIAIVVATCLIHGLLAFAPLDLSGGTDVRIDRWALVFTFAVALVTGVGFGLVPAWLTARADPQGMLKEASARTTGSAGQGRIRNVLVTSEVALSLVLLAGAGLMIRTVANLMHTEPGFDVSHTLSAEIWLTGSRYDTPAAVAGYYRDLTARLLELPGVTAAGVVEAGAPLERGGNMSVSHNGERLQGGVDYRTVTPGYFGTLGVTVRQGRDFTAADDVGAPPVIVVNESFASRYYRDGALQQVLTVGGSDKTLRTVVGVVADVKSFVGFPAPATVFLPSAQTPFGFTRIFNGWFPIHVMVHTAGDPAALAAAVTHVIHDTDPQVPLGSVRTMGQVLDASLSLQRFVMILLSAFAGLAIVLAVVGIYGLISWFVFASTRDIGIRLALGAFPHDVMALVMRRGAGLTLLGAVIGIAGALALTRLLGSLLFEVKSADALTLAAVSLLLVTVALVACWIPARRAARVDPIVSLRSE